MSKKHQPRPLPEGAFVSAAVKRKSRFTFLKLKGRSRKFKITLLVAALLVIGTGGYFVYQHFHQPKEAKAPLVLPEGIAPNYHTIPMDYLDKLLSYDYDLTIQKIESGNLNKIIKKHKMGYDVAVALTRLGKDDRALEAYKIADQKTDQTKTITFYTEYCEAAYKVGQKSVGDHACAQAVSIVKQKGGPDGYQNARINAINSVKSQKSEE